MKIVTTFHASSTVSHSLKCNLTADPGVEHLVIVQLNRLQVFSCQPQGLKHETTLEIWGRIISIKCIPIQDCHRSNLLVMIDHPTPELIFLTYSVSSAGFTLTTTKSLSLYERSPRQAEYLNDTLVDPSGRLAVVSCYTGKLKFILMNGGKYDRDFDLSISELNILSLAFVPTVDSLPSLAILHQDHRERIQLLSRDINVADMELLPSLSIILQSTVISSKSLLRTDSLPILVPVAFSPECPGGMLLIGGRKILLFELATNESQEKQKGKHRRTEMRKKSTDITEVQRAKQKEMAREYRKRKPRATVEWPWSEVTAWCVVGKTPMKLLLGDSFGRLAMLSVNISKELALILLPLGEASPASTLAYLSTQVVYLGSHFGDSQLLRINSSPAGSFDASTLPMPTKMSDMSALRRLPPNDGDDADSETEGRPSYIIENKGQYVTVLQTFKNIAPIVDAAFVDVDGTEQRQIVTCSGGRNTGSLNIIRNGADFEELAVIAGINDVTNIWTIRAFFKDDLDSHVLVSTIQDSHLFRFDGANLISRVVPVSIGFILNLPTLAARNISKRLHNKGGQITSSYADSSLVVQVTPKALILLEFELSLGEYTQVGESWTPRNLFEPPRHSSQVAMDSQIVAASINPSQFVLALSHAKIVLLNLNEKDKFQVMSHRNVGDYSANHCEISSVSCIPQDPSKYYTTLVAVSFWGSNCVEVFSIERTHSRLSSICKSSTLPAIPRSLLLYDFGQPGRGSDGPENAHLLVGLGNGMITSFALRDRELVDQRTVLLGGAPVCITAYEVDGRPTVFASGGRASIFFWNKNRLQNSPVIFKDIVAASRLNTRWFPSCLILATVAGLLVGKARELDKIHIRSVPLGLDNPRRITYDGLNKVIGLACTRSEAVQVGDLESPRSFFRLLDAGTLIHLSQFNCEPDEEITAVETLSLMLGDRFMSYFCVGTFFYQADEREPIAGRLLVFCTHEASPHPLGRRLALIASAQTQGCIYALANANGMVAAAINASVVIYRLCQVTHRSSTTFGLNKVTEWTHNYLIRSLVAHDDHLVLGDAISSVSILKLADAQLSMVARDYGPLWPVCVQALDKNHIIGANADLNIFTFALQHSDGQAVLEVEGSYHVADMITKFLPGSLTSRKLWDNMILEPQQLFFTSSGCIGVIIDIGKKLASQLAALQQNMSCIVGGKDGTTHTKYRAPKNSRGVTDSSHGFLDGDFLEQFLVCSSVHEKILAGNHEAEHLTMTASQIQNILETLQSMH